jgi:hypothetical protein
MDEIPPLNMDIGSDIDDAIYLSSATSSLNTLTSAFMQANTRM